MNPVFANSDEEPNYLPDTKTMFSPPSIADYNPPEPKREKPKPKPVFAAPTEALTVQHPDVPKFAT